MIYKENKIFRKMFKVTEYAALRVKKFMMEDPSYIKFEAQ